MTGNGVMKETKCNLILLNRNLWYHPIFWSRIWKICYCCCLSKFQWFNVYYGYMYMYVYLYSYLHLYICACLIIYFFIEFYKESLVRLLFQGNPWASGHLRVCQYWTSFVYRIPVSLNQCTHNQNSMEISFNIESYNMSCYKLYSNH